MASTFSLQGKLGLDSRDFVRGAKQAEGAIGDVSDDLNKLPNEAGRSGSKAGGLLSSNLARGFAMAGGAAALAAGFKSTIDAASNLEESTNAVGVAFGEAGDDVLKFGENSAEAYGLSKTAFNEAAVGFSSFAIEIAGSGGDVAGTLDDLMTRATDMASVFNVSVPDAAEAMRSALSGEAEPMKRFGIVMTEAKVEAYALSAGIIDSGESMDDAQKQAARYGFIMEQTAKVQGDWQNTNDGFAGSMKILEAKFEDFQAMLGQELLPMVNDVVGGLLDLYGVWEALEAAGPVKMVIEVTGNDSLAGTLKDAVDFSAGIPGLNAGISALRDVHKKWSNVTHEGNGELNAASVAVGIIRERAEDYRDAIIDASKAQEDAIEAEEDRKKSIEDNVKALNDVVQAQEDARKATEDARIAQLEAIDSSLAYRNQQADTAAAVRDGTEAMNDATLSADEQAQASRDVEAAVLDQAAAAVALAEDQADANDEMITAEQKNAIYVEELESLVGYLSGPAREAVQGYIDTLTEIPTEITTAVRVTATGLNVATPAYRDKLRSIGAPDAAIAEGGPFRAGGSYLVGEEGPEMIFPSRAGYVATATQTAALFGKSVSAPAPTHTPVAASSGLANGSPLTINHYGPQLSAADVSRGFTLARLAQAS
jgi:hypothetical protein